MSRSLPSRHWRSMAFLAVALVVVAGVAWLATRADGRPGSASSSNDGGAWLLNREAGAIGHLNREVLEVTAGIRVANPHGDFDVDQAGDIIVVHDRSLNTLALIDGRTHQRRGEVAIPSGVTVQALSTGALLTQDEPFTMWQLSTDQLLDLTELDGVDPAVEGEAAGVAVIGFDETIWPSTAAIDPTRSVTMVGNKVVGNSDAQLVAVELDGSVTVMTNIDELAGPEATMVLQQPSVALPEVTMIDADGSLYAMSMSDGSGRVVAELGGGSPLAPIVHRGCVFAVTMTPSPRFQKVCDGEVLDDVPLDGAGQELRLRLVNNWVWINDLSTGGAWITSAEGTLSRIDDWGDALADDEDDEADATVEDNGGVEEVRVNPDAEEAELFNADEIDEDDENEAPIARDDQAATRTDRPVIVHVLANDEDPDGDVLLVTALGEPSEPGGQLATIPDQSAVQLTPPAGFSGNIRFTYTISDGRGGTDSAEVSVEVTTPDAATNRAPVAVTDVATVRAGSPVEFNVLSNDSDPDGDSLVLVSVSAPSGGVVFASDGTVTFTPDGTDDEGQIELSYVVADEYGVEATGRALMNIRLREANSAPDARNDSVVAVVDRPAVTNVLDNDHDPDADLLIVASQPTLISAPGTATATATAAATQTAALTVDGEFTFTPTEVGIYLFEYLISDGQNSDAARIRVDVVAADENRPPVAVRDDVAIPAGATRLVSALANDGDPDGDVVAIVEWSSADGLIIEEVPGVGFRVTVEPDAPQTVEFRYAISDGVADVVGTSVIVSVVDAEATNQPPVAKPDSVEVRAGRSTEIAVLANDHDPEGGALRIMAPPEIAGLDVTFEVSADGQTIIVTVGEGVTESFTFGYEVGDENASSASATVEVRVIPEGDPNRPPIARIDTGRTSVGQPVSIDVLANDSDPDGDAISIESIAAQPPHGTATIVGPDDERWPEGTILYEPNDDFGGSDRFLYVVVDTEGARTIGSVQIGVAPQTPENRSPSASADRFTLAYGGDTISLDVLANDSDPDHDPLVVVSAGFGSAATATIGEIVLSDSDTPTIRFTPPPLPETGGVIEARDITFTYSISDGRGGSAEGLVTVTLESAPEPVAPVAVNDSVGPVSADSSVRVAVLNNDLDDDGDPSALVVTSTDPAVSVEGNAVIIDVGAESGQYPYTITDPDGLSDSGEVTVFVVDNAAPTVRRLTAATDTATAIVLDLDAQASDEDGDELYFVCCDNVIGGSAAVLAAGAGQLQVEFTPSPNFSGNATFSYSVDDQQGHLVSGSVVVEVSSIENRPPVAANSSLTMQAGSTVPFSLLSLVDDPDVGDAIAIQASASEGLRVGPVVDGSVQISADLSAGGRTSTVTYTATDGQGAEATGTVSVTVELPSAPPVQAIADSASTNQGIAVTLDLVGNDVDPLGEGLTIVSVGTSADGSATNNGDGSMTFTPNNDFFGTVTLRYTVRDGANSADREDTGTAVIQVVGRPDVPGPPLADADNATATITWSTPQSNGAIVESYELEIVNIANGSTTKVDSTATSYAATGLSNGDAYQFRIRAKNVAGWSEWSGWSADVTPDTRPLAPAAPQAGFGDGQLDVTWNAPTNDGSAITGYKLEIGGGTSDVIDLGSGLSYDWRSLTNGVEYQFRVAAVNAAGDSDWSGWSSSEHPLGPPLAPAAPVVARGDRFLDVDWSVPGTNGDPIANYDLEIRSSGQTVQVVGAGTTDYRWADLANGVAQEFRVRASNRAASPGAWSNWSTPVTPCAVPDAAGRPTVTRGDGQVTVQWDEPGDQGCAITQYRVSVGDVVATTGGDSTSLVVTGLANGTSYTASVVAVNEVGAGQASPESASFIPAGPPTAPTISSAAAQAVGSITVTYGGSTPNGAAITGYEVSINNGGAVSAGNPHTASGLQANTSYDFRIRACNEVGCGSWSASRTATTWGPPSQVALTVTASHNTLVANWSAPASTGGSAITGYEITRSPGSFEAGASTLRARTWTDVTNGTTYSVTIRACNSVGCGPTATASATPVAPPAEVTVSVGSAYSGAECDTAACARIAVDAKYFTPSSTLTVVCSSTFEGDYLTYTATADAVGDYLGERCIFGYPGEEVWVTVNGVTSNRVVWPA